MAATMLRLLLVLAGIVACRTSVCNHCVCRYDAAGDQDFTGAQIDCSYKSEELLDIETLPALAFTLDLSSSNISRVKQSSLLHSQTLTELYLNDNIIREIEIKALALPELVKLDLSDNQLEHIDKEIFRNLHKLEYLNLANNLFTTFAKLEFHHLSNLNEIILDYNDLGTSLHEVSLFERNGVGLTPKIKSLSLKAIKLHTVPDNLFVDAYDIRKLIISGNNITDIFELPTTLEYLDLSDNPIEEICEEDLANVPGLRELKLNNLAINEVPDFVFAPLRGLIKLELERNKNLTVFSKLAFGQEVLEDADDFVLERLSLSGSRLSRLDVALIEPFGHLFQLDLQGNPWICDCKLLWLKQLQIPPEDYDHLRCGQPLPLFNSRIFELKAKYFVCEPPKHRIALILAVFTFCVSSSLLGIWIYFFLPKRNPFKHCYNPYKNYTVLSIPTSP